MTLRLPQNLAGESRHQGGLNPLEAEIKAEQAAALGRSGRAVQAALAELRTCPAQPGSAARDALVDAAAERVWGFLVQRELCGLRDEKQVVAEYAIPAEVLARAGARGRGRGR